MKPRLHRGRRRRITLSQPDLACCSGREFASAQQFLDAYRRNEPGCLVVDMDLSGGGAVGLLRTLAAAQIVLPAIITSRRLRRGVPVGGLPPGPILFLDKPFGIEELLRLIRTASNAGSGSQTA